MLVTSGIEAWNHPVLGTYNGSEPQSCWRERELGIVSPDNGNLICAASISDGLWPRTTFLGQPSLSFGQKSQPFHLFSMVFGENPISPMLSLVFPWFFYGFPMVFLWFSHGFPCFESRRSPFFSSPRTCSACPGTPPRRRSARCQGALDLDVDCVSRRRFCM